LNSLIVSFTAKIYRDRSAGGYYARVSELPGCWTQGETLKELRENLAEAVQGWIESLAKDAPQARAPRMGSVERTIRVEIVPAL
jgi:predicted RNase H-like HicB family nuclease